MKFKKLAWRNFLANGKYMTTNEFRADVKINGLFGIRFQYGLAYLNNYYYFYIINGKRYGDLFGFKCDSLEQGKKLCEEKYEEICNAIIDTLCAIE